MCEEGIAMFPDAPTTRGTRHLETLIDLKERGEPAAILFLVFRPEARCFSANGEIDALFAATFEKAVRQGIDIFPLRFAYRDGSIIYLGRLPLCA
jgi:sugar fermentation stimulation protein A